MILTEADLHAYNRGELSPEATRQLESDPLAMEDAARLRLISTAIRNEAPLPVTGRAETLERLRADRARGIGVPRWVWGLGIACVAGLIAVSLPPTARPGFVIRQVVYEYPVAESTSAAASVSSDLETAPPAPIAEPRSNATVTRAAPSAAVQDRTLAESKGKRGETADSLNRRSELRVREVIGSVKGEILSDRRSLGSQTFHVRLDRDRARELKQRLSTIDLEGRITLEAGLPPAMPELQRARSRASEGHSALAPEVPAKSALQEPAREQTQATLAPGGEDAAIDRAPASSATAKVDVTITVPDPPRPQTISATSSASDGASRIGIGVALLVGIGGLWFLARRRR